MGATASQITSLTIVYSSVCSGADQRKHQSSASLAFVWGIHRWPVNSPHKWPVTWKTFPYNDAIMTADNWVMLNSFRISVHCYCNYMFSFKKLISKSKAAHLSHFDILKWHVSDTFKGDNTLLITLNCIYGCCLSISPQSALWQNRIWGRLLDVGNQWTQHSSVLCCWLYLEWPVSFIAGQRQRAARTVLHTRASL